MRRADDMRQAGRTVGVVLALAAVALAVPLAAAADNGKGNDVKAYVPGKLLGAAQRNPDAVFDVVVQGKGKKNGARGTAEDVLAETGAAVAMKKFQTIDGVAVQLTGKQLDKLSRKDSIAAITPNAPVTVAGYSNKQQWPYVSGVAKSWSVATSTSIASRVPTIAIVDSGIDATRPDFGGRVIKSVNLTSLPNNSPVGDGRGHGTFVASIAAGEATGYAGATPTAKLVSIDVADDHGMARTSDVIAAADWIYQNRIAYNIGVANFSLHATNPATFRFDPLDKAVEKLWFSGVVVVAAAGNYATNGQRSDMPYAPGNDPFVITVGAADIDGSVSTKDDFAAPWSAYGYTLDGFAKPDLGAPGRYLIGAVPPGSSLALERPDKMVGTEHIQMSGTSFAAPVVSGAAAYLLAAHSDWGPDQVKGALMLTVKPTPSAITGSIGVGEVNVAKAVDVTTPPNPNLALNRFLIADPNGGPIPVFDEGAWVSAASTDAAWLSAAWTSAAWTSASFSTAAWTSAAWTSAAWTSAAWTSAAWTSAAWTSESESDATWMSNAEDDTSVDGGYTMTPEELAAAEAELGLTTGG